MPSKAEIELAKKDASNRIAAIHRRYKSRNIEAMLVRKSALVGTAALYGTLNRLGVPITVGGFPWKLGVGTLALLGEGMTRGPTQTIFAGIADATLAIYIERSISTDTVIAGHDDDDDEDDIVETPQDDGGEI